MTGPVLLTSDADGVRTLLLNRPRALNALDRALMEALTAALDDADADPAVGAVLLAGNHRPPVAGKEQTGKIRCVRTVGEALVTTIPLVLYNDDRHTLYLETDTSP